MKGYVKNQKQTVLATEREEGRCGQKCQTLQRNYIVRGQKRSMIGHTDDSGENVGGKRQTALGSEKCVKRKEIM